MANFKVVYYPNVEQTDIKMRLSLLTFLSFVNNSFVFYSTRSSKFNMFFSVEMF